MSEYERVLARLRDLNRQVLGLSQERQFDKAEVIAVRALELAAGHLRHTDPELATALNNLGELRRMAGFLDEAQQLHNKALTIREQASGSHRLPLAESLQNLGYLASERAEWDLASDHYGRAFSIRREHLGDEHPLTAQSLYRLGAANVARGLFEVGVRQLEDALIVERQFFGVGAYEPVETLLTLGTILRDAQQLERAAALYRCELDLMKASSCDEGPYYENLVDRLAEIYEVQGDFRRSADVLTEVVATMRRAGRRGTKSFLAALNNLAGVLHLAGEYDLAVAAIDECIELTRAADGAAAQLATALGTAAQLRQQQGDLDSAEALLRDALAVETRDLGRESASAGVTLINLGSVLKDRGKLAAAQFAFEEARHILRRTVGEHDLNYGVASQNLGSLFLQLGDYAAAKPLLEIGLEIRRAQLGPNHPDVAQSLANLAYLDFATGGVTGSGQQLRESIRILQSGLTAPLQLVGSLHNLAAFYWQTGNRSGAMATARQAVELCRSRFGEGHVNTARTWRQLATLHYFAGSLAKCEDELARAMAIQREQLGESHADFIDSLTLLTRLHATKGQGGEALRTIKQATQSSGELIREVFAAATESRRLAFLQTLRHELDVYMSVVVSFQLDSPEAIREAFEFVLARKGLTAEALAVQRDAILKGRYPGLRPQLESLQAVRSEVARLTLDSPVNSEQREKLRQLRQERDRLEVELAREIPEVRRVQQQRVIQLADLADRLPAGSCLIDFLRIRLLDFSEPASPGSEHYLAFTLTAGDVDTLRLVNLGVAKEIDDQISQFRASMSAMTRGSRALFPATKRDEHGRAMRRAVLDPALPSADVLTLFISPDSELARLPFAVLQYDDGSLVIDRHEVNYLAVPRDVLCWKTEPCSTNAAFVLGDPDFDLSLDEELSGADHSALNREPIELRRAGLRFSRLAGTRREAQDIAQLLCVEPVCGAEAAKGRLLRQSSPRILHLATHGFFLPETMRPSPIATPWLDGADLELGLGRLQAIGGAGNPLVRSGLALAGANTWLAAKQPSPDAENGILLAEEVTGLDLLGTQLVVLSACETGLGDIRVGEGVFGLRRAFKLAGASALVVSLWKVPDEATRQLMTEFYRRLIRGEPASSALRSAQLSLKSDPALSHPFHWGAFLLEGDPGSIEMS